MEFVELGPWDYFLVKILGPIWMGFSFVGICGGLITAFQHGVWAAKSGARVCKSCKKKPQSDEELRTAHLLMELMGDSQSMPMNNRRAPPPDVRYTSRFGNKEEKVEITELPRM